MIVSGYPDTAVNSNDKIKNQNTNVLEFIQKQPGYKGQIAVFSTWVPAVRYIRNK